ncbi:MAG: uL15 family ribosomal protein [Candidatus Woesearchaeota archaeon]
MPTNKRKKSSRMRGSGSHGWGSKKSHRGTGRKGGAGFSGTGKRADQMKPLIWKNREFFGKHGFYPHGSPKKKPAVNISYLEENLEKLIEQKLVEKVGDKYIINLKNLGFGKLLSEGTPKHKFVITCESASSAAEEKINAAGGEVLVSGAALAKKLKNEMPKEI